MKVDVSFIGGRGVYSNYGGVENAIREICYELVKKGMHINVYGVETKSTSSHIHKNIISISSPKWFYKWMGQYGQILFAVLHSIFVSRPKVVIIFASGPCIFTPILRVAGINVITSLRAIDSQRDKWGIISKTILRIGEYCAWKFPNNFTVNSKEMYDYYYRYNKEVIYIPNGATAGDIPGTEVLSRYDLHADNYYLFAARLDPTKRLDLLLNAYRRLPKAYQYPLVVAGGHSKSEEYENHIMEMAKGDVYFIGHIPQETLYPLMYHCRMFILPSILEGMSNSLLAAMISGKALLAADIKANYDVVEGYDPVLFKSEDENHLLEKLISLTSNDELRMQAGKKMKELAESRFTWKKTANEFYRLIALHIGDAQKNKIDKQNSINIIKK